MNVDYNEERPDVRFWTQYDHFMVMREARAMRRACLRTMLAGHAARAKRLAARWLGNAGAQPARTQRAPG